MSAARPHQKDRHENDMTEEDRIKTNEASNEPLLDGNGGSSEVAENNNASDEGQESAQAETGTEQAGAQTEDAQAAQVENDFRTSLRIRSLEAKISDYETKIGSIRNYVKKMEAEIELIRQRQQKESERQIQEQTRSFFLDLLPIIDNFERSLSVAGDETPFVEGVRMIHQQFLDFLRSRGVARITCRGEVFDPHFHEALSAIPVDDEAQDGRIVEECRAGYKIGEHILRPAQVIVGKRFE